MLQWTGVGAAHWFVFVAFGALFFTLLTAYGQLFDPEFALPVIGHWIVYEWASEVIAWAGLVGILLLMVVRFRLRDQGRSSRFFGSRTWQGVFVELVILGIVLCVLTLRALEFRLLGEETTRRTSRSPGSCSRPGSASRPWAPPSWWCRRSRSISMAWFVVLGLNTTMGVAWHQFTVWPNVWFKRKASGRPALGALPPMMVDRKPLDFTEIEDLDEDAPLVWQGGGLHLEGSARLHLLHRVRPLPVAVPGVAHREAAVAQAADHGPARPRVRQGALPPGRRGGAREPARGGPGRGRPLVGPIQAADGLAGVIDPDVLWSCTSCGACVQQCPVDIEHLDHIMDLRQTRC